MRKAHVLKPDGSIEKIDLNKKTELSQLQEAVGGYIERVKIRYLGRLRDAYVNEDGKAKQLQPNLTASKLWWETQRFIGSDCLSGNVAIVLPKGEPDEQI